MKNPTSKSDATMTKRFSFNDKKESKAYDKKDMKSMMPKAKGKSKGGCKCGE